MSKKRRRNKRRKGLTLKGKIFIYIFLIISILMLIGIIFLTLPGFQLKDININELVKIEEKDVLDKAGFVIGKNVFKQNYFKAKKEIMEIKAVKNVDIKIVLPNNINIEIEERIETYQIKADKIFYVIDEQGYILKELNKKITLPELLGIEPKFKENRLETSELILLEDVNKIYNTTKILNIDGLVSSIKVKTLGFELNFASNKKTAHFPNTSNLMNSMQFVREIIYSTEEKNKAGDIYLTEEGARFRPR